MTRNPENSFAEVPRPRCNRLRRSDLAVGRAERAVILAHVRRRGWGWQRILLVAAVLAVVNLPFLLHQYQLSRAKSDGVHVTATVAGVTFSGDDAIVAFRYPAEVEASQDVHTVKLDRAAGAAAARTNRLDVQVLDGHPSVFHVAGQQRSWGGFVFTGAADVLIVALVLLSWRLGGRLRRPPLEAVAIADVQSGDEGSLLDKQDDGTYLINGEVAETGEQSFVLRLRDRDVTVHLREYHNPLGVGDRAQVRALLVG